jgi:hypothetical protein
MSAYLEGSIADVDLEVAGAKVKAILLDPGGFFSSYQGSIRIAADGTPYTQLTNAGTKGVKFGVLLEFAPLAVLAAIQAAIEAALTAQTPFNVDLSDDYSAIDNDCVPDFTAGNWIDFPGGRMNGAYVKGVTLRFMVTS